MEFIKTHSKKIVLSLGAAALVAGGIYMMKSHQPHILKEIENQEAITNNNSSIFVKDDKYMTAIERLRPVVLRELESGALSKQTIIMINQTVIHVFKSDYLRILVEGRQMRRKFLNNLDLYIAEFMKHTGEAEKLMENASLEVLRDLNITMDEYETNSERIMQQDPNFAMYSLYMFEAVKMQIPSVRTEAVSKQELIDILNFQADEYANVDFSDKGLNPQQVNMLKQTFISDKASLEFKYEEEDLMKNPTLLQDPEVGQVQRRLQEAMMGDQADMYGY